MDLDRKIRDCALELQDSRILAKLSAGDLVALEASYHRSCLISFYRRAEKTHEKEEDDENGVLNGIALAELVDYIQNAKLKSEKSLIFKLSHLCDLYKQKLSELGLEVTRIHSTRLKERLQVHFPDLQDHKMPKVTSSYLKAMLVKL